MCACELSLSLGVLPTTMSANSVFVRCYCFEQCVILGTMTVKTEMTLKRLRRRVQLRWKGEMELWSCEEEKDRGEIIRKGEVWGGKGGQEIEERQRGIKEKMMGGGKAWRRRSLIKGKWQVNQRKTWRWRERKSEKILIVFEEEGVWGGGVHTALVTNHISELISPWRGLCLSSTWMLFSGAIMVKVATFWWENYVIITPRCNKEPACCSPICPCYTNSSYWLSMWLKGCVNKGSGGNVRRSLALIISCATCKTESVIIKCVCLCAYVHESLRMCVHARMCMMVFWYQCACNHMLFAGFLLILPQAQTWNWFLLAVCWDLIWASKPCNFCEIPTRPPRQQPGRKSSSNKSASFPVNTA